jgi:hypothetical protein
MAETHLLVPVQYHSAETIHAITHLPCAIANWPSLVSVGLTAADLHGSVVFGDR